MKKNFIITNIPYGKNKLDCISFANRIFRNKSYSLNKTYIFGLFVTKFGSKSKYYIEGQLEHKFIGIDDISIDRLHKVLYLLFEGYLRENNLCLCEACLMKVKLYVYSYEKSNN